MAPSSMERFVALVKGFQLLTNFTKNSILGVTGFLDLWIIMACSEIPY